MAEQLTFVPKYHQWIDAPNCSGWTLKPLPGFDAVLCMTAIIQEQNKIQAEGGAIILFDAKGDFGDRPSLEALVHAVQQRN